MREANTSYAPLEACKSHYPPTGEVNIKRTPHEKFEASSSSSPSSSISERDFFFVLNIVC